MKNDALLNSQCPHCFRFVDNHQTNNRGVSNLLHSEEYFNFYGRICNNCKKYIKPTLKPKIVIENEKKLKQLQEQVRNQLREQYKRRCLMAIDQAHVNLQFKYVSDEIQGVEFLIKYYQSNGVDMVSLSEDGENWSDLPASLFMETTDFIKRNSQLPSGVANSHPYPHSLQSPPGVRNSPVQNFSQPPSPQQQVNLPEKRRLPIPNVNASTASSGTNQPSDTNQAEDLYVHGQKEPANMEPLQSLGGLSSYVSHGPEVDSEVGEEPIIDRPTFRSEREPATDQEAIAMAKAVEQQRASMGGKAGIKRKED